MRFLFHFFAKCIFYMFELREKIESHFLAIFSPSKMQFSWTQKNTKTRETKMHITQNFEKK